MKNPDQTPVYLCKNRKKYHLAHCKNRNEKNKEMTRAEAQKIGATVNRCCDPKKPQNQSKGDKDMAENFELPKALKKEESCPLPEFSPGNSESKTITEPNRFNEAIDAAEEKVKASQPEEQDPESTDAFDDDDEIIDDFDEDAFEGLGLSADESIDEFDLEGNLLNVGYSEGSEDPDDIRRRETFSLAQPEISDDEEDEDKNPQGQEEKRSFQIVGPEPESEELKKSQAKKEKKRFFSALLKGEGGKWKRTKNFFRFLWENVICAIFFIDLFMDSWKGFWKWKKKHPKVLYYCFVDVVLFFEKKWNKLKLWKLLSKKEKKEKDESKGSTKKPGLISLKWKAFWGRTKATWFKVRSFLYRAWISIRALVGKHQKKTLFVCLLLLGLTSYKMYPVKTMTHVNTIKVWGIESKNKVLEKYQDWQQKKDEKAEQAEQVAKAAQITGPPPTFNKPYKADFALISNKSPIKFSLERIEVGRKGTKLFLRIQNTGSLKHAVSIDTANSTVADRTGQTFLKGASPNFKYFCGSNRVGLAPGEIAQGYLRFEKPADFRREVMIQILDLEGNEYSLNIHNLLDKEE